MISFFCEIPYGGQRSVAAAPPPLLLLLLDVVVAVLLLLHAAPHRLRRGYPEHPGDDSRGDGGGQLVPDAHHAVERPEGGGERVGLSRAQHVASVGEG